MTHQMLDDSKCEGCGGAVVLDERRGERVCSACGLVTSESLMLRPNEDDVSYHRGPATSVHTESSLSTTFFDQSRDASGRAIPEAQRDRVRRMAFVAGRTRKYKERALGNIQNQVKDISSRLELPEALRNRAFFLAKQAYDQHLFAGREFSIFAAGCVYLAAREQGIILIPKNLVAVVQTVAKNPVSQVFKVYNKLKRQFDIKSATVTSEQILPQAAYKAFGGLGSADIAAMLHAARQVLAEIQGRSEHDTQHRKPEVDVAAALWVVALRTSIGITQPEICRVCQVSDVALRLRLYEVYPELVKRIRRGGEGR